MGIIVGQWLSLGLSWAQYGSLEIIEVSGVQWISVGLSEDQCTLYIYTPLF